MHFIGLFIQSRMADMTSNPEIASLIAGDSPVINSISPKSKDFISSEYEQRHVTEAEKQTLFFIKEAIKRYFVVVRKKLQDSVPKTIMHFLVKYVKNQLNTELVSKLYVTQQMEKLFEESVNVIEKRKEASDNLKALLRINEIINELRDGQFA